MFVAKDQVDPVSYKFTCVVGFKLYSVLHDEVVGRRGPDWQLDVVNSFLQLGQSEIMLVDVQQAFGQVKELRSELSDVRNFPSHAFPAGFDRRKETI